MELNEQESAVIARHKAGEKITEYEIDLLCARSLGLNVRWWEQEQFLIIRDDDRNEIPFTPFEGDWYHWHCTIVDLWPWVESLNDDLLLECNKHMGCDSQASRGFFGIQIFERFEIASAPTKLDALKNLLIKVTWP